MAINSALVAHHKRRLLNGSVLLFDLNANGKICQPLWVIEFVPFFSDRVIAWRSVSGTQIGRHNFNISSHGHSIFTVAGALLQRRIRISGQGATRLQCGGPKTNTIYVRVDGKRFWASVVSDVS